MAPYVELIKWAPVGLEIISQAGKLYEALKAKFDSTPDNADDEIMANKEIDKRSERLINIGHSFLPERFQATAEIPEVVKFKNDVISVVISIRTAIESFQLLLVK